MKTYRRRFASWWRGFSGLSAAGGKGIASYVRVGLEGLERRELLTTATAIQVVVPSSVTAGVESVQALLVDGSSQVDTSNNAAVSISITRAGSTVTQTVTAAAVNGVATFTNIDLTLAGNYSFQAVDAADGLSGSGATTAVAGPAAKLVSGVPPQNITLTSGGSVGFFVDLEDQFGNAVAGDGSVATLQLLSAPAGGSMTGPTTVTMSPNVANQFWPEQFAGRGVFQLQITDGSLTPLTETVTVAPRPTVLHSFAGGGDPVNGSGPGSLVFDSDGNMFGITSSGGANGTGTLFEITHDTHQFVTLASLDATWAELPSAPVVDKSGNVYVATSQNIVELPRGSNTLKTIYNFKYDGEFNAALTVDASGNLYGIAHGEDGRESVFELKAGATQPTTLADLGQVASFAGGVTLDGAGNVYGLVNMDGGANGRGFVFEVVKGASASTTLASFDAATNQISSDIAVDPQGDVYGVTNEGIYEIVGGSGRMTSLFTSSNPQAAGWNLPWSGVMLDSAGDLFGTSPSYGDASIAGGSVYMLPAGGTTPVLLTLFDSTDGLYPGSLTVDGDGNLYGSTSALPATLTAPAYGGNIFEVANVATVYHLVILQQPSTVVAGDTLGDVQVAVEDAAGNIVSSDNSNITLALRPGDYGGIATVQAVNGIATFSGLTLTQAGDFTLRATDGIFKAATGDLEVLAGAPASIGFVSVPGQVTAGNNFNLAAQAYDVYGNPTTTFPGIVAPSGGMKPMARMFAADVGAGGGVSRLSVVGGPSGASMAVSSMSATNGRAVFGVKLLKAGSYTLRLDDGAFSAETSTGLTVMADAAHPHIAFVQQPTQSFVGARMAPIRVEFQDAYGNPINRGGAIQLSIASGPSGALKGQTTAQGVETVSFNNVSLGKNGTYKLQASFNKTTAVSNPFSVFLPAAQLKASNVNAAVAGGAIGPVTVQAVDSTGKVVTQDHSFVTVSIVGGGTLLGATRVEVVNGVATFRGLSTTKAGTYKLIFSDGALKTATTNSFVVTPNLASAQLKLLKQPVSGVAGKVLSPGISVEVVDRFGNLVTTDSSPVVLSIAQKPSGGSISAGATANANKGVATFGLTILSKAGEYVLHATDLSLAIKTPLTINLTAI
ncbi:MAG TPA: choice-of-anchor tandem repeat GloVer-containing protein [Phycisphaerae bacterium]|nr:choice-of-anchor tandem repeat GloVer-containing protein [Phycisphaerae bacterium]